MKLSTVTKMLASLSFFACTSLFAAPLTVNVAGVQSIGEFGEAGNTVLTYNVGANSTITNVTYSFNLTAFNPSYLSEIGLAFTDSDVTQGVLLNPGFGVAAPGTGTYSDTIDLVLEDLVFSVGADGILRLEFYEDFDDGGVNPDGIWNSGTITFEIDGYEPPVDPGTPGQVPEPATALLMAAGLGMLGYGRRRKAAKPAI